jgi:hypothetical protein
MGSMGRISLVPSPMGTDLGKNRQTTKSEVFSGSVDGRRLRHATSSLHRPGPGYPGLDWVTPDGAGVGREIFRGMELSPEGMPSDDL